MAAGVSVTKQLSGASRATIDACRTLFIWAFSLQVGWEQFHMLQVGGGAGAQRGQAAQREGAGC